jgi:predicted membrane chloride channel (bestrophin family)
MKFNQKQRSYLIIFAGFALVVICYEIGYYFFKGHISLQYTPFILVGAFLGSVIGFIANKNK